MMTILMTGATGFLGSNMLPTLAARYNVVGLKRSHSNTSRVDLSEHSVTWYNVDDMAILETVFQENKIDCILHCATNYGGGNTRLISLIETNLMLPLRLLEIGRKRELRCFINTDTILDKGTNYYSLSKRHFAEWLQKYSDELHCVNLALEHFYGPYDNETKFVSHIVNTLLRDAKEINLTRGDQRRDFIYISDVVDAVMIVIDHSLEQSVGFSNFEIATDQTHSIREVVTMAKSLCGNRTTKLNFGAIPYRPREVMEMRVDTSAIRRLGWTPKVSLKDGLIATIQEEKERIANEDPHHGRMWVPRK